MKKFDLIVEEKTFTNEKNEQVKYLDLRTEIKGQSFKLQVRKEDKQLFNYLVKGNV